MSDDGNRHDHPPTAGEQNFSENGSETTENDQSGLPPWAAALTAQVTAQLQASFTAQFSANQEALRTHSLSFTGWAYSSPRMNVLVLVGSKRD